MIYHLLVAVLGIALLYSSWMWVQGRAKREECEGLGNVPNCAVGPGCHGCLHAARGAIIGSH